jgi:hypothetical protein
MFLSNLGRFFGRAPPPMPAAPPPEERGAAKAAPVAPQRPAARKRNPTALPADPWSDRRIAVSNRLWGTGFILPGGEPEIIRLSKPTGATGDNRLLLVGVGSGGAALVIEQNTQTWLTALESDPHLLAAARALVTAAKLGKRVVVDAWDPVQPQFKPAGHKNCLALEPMRQAGCGTILPALAGAISPGGNLIVTDIASMEPIPPGDPLIARWAALEHRKINAIPTPQAVAAVLQAHRMDLRIAEDISQRHIDQVMLGWRELVAAMAENKPPPDEASRVVAEAELWLLRRKLIETGRLRMMRWHAIKPG